jgi:hypothetical protein
LYQITAKNGEIGYQLLVVPKAAEILAECPDDNLHISRVGTIPMKVGKMKDCKIAHEWSLAPAHNDSLPIQIRQDAPVKHPAQSNLG